MKPILLILLFVLFSPSSIIASESTLFDPSIFGSDVSSSVILFKPQSKSTMKPNGLQLKTDHDRFYYCTVGYNSSVPFLEFVEKLSKEYGNFRIETQEKYRRISNKATWILQKQHLTVEAVSVGNDPYILVAYTELSPIDVISNMPSSSIIDLSKIVLFDPSILGTKISSAVHLLPPYPKSSLTPTDVRLGTDGEIFTNATVFYSEKITFKQLEDLLARRYGSPSWRLGGGGITNWAVGKEHLAVQLMSIPEGAVIEYSQIK
jgi:hypothetical protein